MDRNATDGTLTPTREQARESASASSERAVAVSNAGRREDGGSREWSGHPVDIRLTIPLPFRSFYVTIVAGTERRSTERRASERKKHPLITAGNLLVYMTVGGVCGLAVLGIIQLLLAHALLYGSLWAAVLFGLLFLAGVAVCIWLLVRQPVTAGRRADGASGATESAS